MMMPQPQFRPMPQGNMPQQQPPRTQVPRQQAPVQQRPQPLAAAPLPKPKVLGQSPDDPPPPPPPPPAPPPVAVAMINLPSPEQLGVAAPKPGEVGLDWGTVETRLQKLQPVCFQINQAQGGWKVICVLPTSLPEKTHRIETEAASRAEAVMAALQRAEQWASQLSKKADAMVK
jgi:hypothetical protein